MIWSVSTLFIGSGTMRLSKLVNGFIAVVLTSVTTPVMALAAAVSGLARNVRPPLPCRPSKLRLLVETLYWPGCKLIAVHRDAHGAARLAPFAAGLAEDLAAALRLRPAASPPATRAPPSRAPSDSPCGPSAAPAAVRRSEMRELVQLPMKTTSTGCPSSGLPPSRPM